MTLDYDIQTAFSGIQLILVFVTVLFGIFYSPITNAINKKIKNVMDSTKLKSIEKELTHILISNCFILILLNGFASYLFSPLFLQLIKESSIFFWTYNFTQGCFFFITLIIYGFFLWSIKLTIELSIRIYKDIPKRSKELEEFEKQNR